MGKQLIAPHEAARLGELYEPLGVAPTIERVVLLGIAHTAMHMREVAMLRGRLGLGGGPF